MNDIVNDRVGPMLYPPHLGELIPESMDEVGWNETGRLARRGVEPTMLPPWVPCAVGRPGWYRAGHETKRSPTSGSSCLIWPWEESGGWSSESQPGRAMR